MEEPQQEKAYSFNKSFFSHYSLRKSLVIRGILSSAILYLKHENFSLYNSKKLFFHE